MLTVFTGLLLLFLAACGGAEPAATIVPPTLDPNSPAGRGKVLFSTHCATCHTVEEGTDLVGPSLAGIGSAAAGRVEDMDAEFYLSRSILYPDDFVVEGYEAGTMQQNFAATLTSEEVDNLVAYLLMLQ